MGWPSTELRLTRKAQTPELRLTELPRCRLAVVGERGQGRGGERREDVLAEVAALHHEQHQLPLHLPICVTNPLLKWGEKRKLTSPLCHGVFVDQIFFKSMDMGIFHPKIAPLISSFI